MSANDMALPPSKRHRSVPAARELSEKERWQQAHSAPAEAAAAAAAAEEPEETKEERRARKKAKKEKKAAAATAAAAAVAAGVLNPAWLRCVAAPMVGCSDLAYRLLVRRHGATLAYTQMYEAARLLADADGTGYRREFQTSGADRPLLVQLAGNDAATMVGAAQLVQGRCDGICINLGCPQQRALDGHYGSYLTGREDWPLLRGMVAAMAAALSVPVVCKVRLQPSLADTIELCVVLQESGAAMIAVHGRGAGTATERRTGAADLEAVAAIKKALRIPVLANGNVRTAADIARNRATTGCDGIMVAEALLVDPGIFAEEELLLAAGDGDGEGEGGGGGEGEGEGWAEAADSGWETAGASGAGSAGGYGGVSSGGAVATAATKRSKGANNGDSAAVAARALLPLEERERRRVRLHGIAREYLELWAESRAARGFGDDGYQPKDQSFECARSHTRWLMGKHGHGDGTKFEHRGKLATKKVKTELGKAKDVQALRALVDQTLGVKAAPGQYTGVPTWALKSKAAAQKPKPPNSRKTFA